MICSMIRTNTTYCEGWRSLIHSMPSFTETQFSINDQDGFVRNVDLPFSTPTAPVKELICYFLSTDLWNSAPDCVA
jgi:hypothetical protein